MAITPEEAQGEKRQWDALDEKALELQLQPEDLPKWLTTNPTTEKPKAVKPKGLDLKRAASSTALLVPDQVGSAFLELLTHPAIQEVTINEKGARLTWHVLQLLLLSAKKYGERYSADPTTTLPFLKAGKTYETKEEVVAAVTDLVFHGERYRQSAPIISFTAADLRHHNAKFRRYKDKQFQAMVDEANAVSITYKTARIELPGEEEERYYLIPGRLVTIVTEVQERTKLQQGQRAKKETVWHLVCKDPFTLSFLNDIHQKCIQLLPPQFNDLSGTGQELLIGCLWSARNPNYFGLRQARKMLGWKKPKNASDVTEQIHRLTKLLEEAKEKKLIKRKKVTGQGERTRWKVWK
jgi:hypothetical protein